MIIRRAALQALVVVLGAASVTIGWDLARAQATERLGLEGYDPVAYFTLSVPTPGLPQHEHVYDGVRYRFANARHLALFKASPEKYLPQFGRQCANNMSNGVRRESDPAVWIIADGKLYVFAGPSGRNRFQANFQTLSAQAAANWKDPKNTPSQ